MIEYVEVYRKDINNVGDIFSNPLRYFADKSNVVSVDIAHLENSPMVDDVPVVIGGGGLIANEHFGELAGMIAEGADVTSLVNMYNNRWKCKNTNNEQLFATFNEQFQALYSKTLAQLKSNKGPKIIWGAGHNKQNWNSNDEIKWPSWMSKFDLVGIRDYMQGYEWVPCASCMHPAFDKQYEITNQVVWFEHKKQLIKPTDMGPDPVPRFINSGGNMEQIIALLGSAETVVTNSYHGVYWATLLGRKVICADAWSSKFYYFKHKPAYTKSKDWRDHLNDAPSYPDALAECRNANKIFWNKVQQL